MANELRFQRLRLKNWKNFLDVDVEIRDRMFLVGANAAGKSNLLDVFRFLKDLASVTAARALSAVWRRGARQVWRSRSNCAKTEPTAAGAM